MTVSAIKRGSGQLAILTVLAEGRLHGYEIAKRIEQQTAGVLRFNLASLYPMRRRSLAPLRVLGTGRTRPRCSRA